jgi:hypothetical protein
MKEIFLYVLENYPDANLSSEEARESIASALENKMRENHIISHTDLDAVENDPKMKHWIDYCKSKKDDRDIEDIQIQRGL